jgi:single-strand DNA-binding protein
MAGLIEGTLVGYLAADPKARQTTAGEVAQLSIPVSEGKEKPTTWVRVSVFGKQATTINATLRKGDMVACSGSLQTRTWEKDGKTNTDLEMLARSVKFLKVAAWSSNGPAASPSLDGPSDADVPF